MVAPKEISTTEINIKLSTHGQGQISNIIIKINIKRRDTKTYNNELQCIDWPVINLISNF